MTVSPPPPVRARWLLAFVLVAAALHAATTALVRPMFQVSDEIGYFALAQQVALGQVAGDAVARERVMPGGRPFYNSPGGKPLFGRVAGSLFAAAARRHPSADAALIVRLAIAGCHVAVVLAAWCVARRFYPADHDVAFVAAMFAAWQPVLAAVNAGLTPDAFANACSAWALYCVALAFTTRHAWLSLLVATGLAAVAFAFKDTALCVFAAVAWGAAACAARRTTGRILAVAGTVVLVTLGVLAAAIIRSPYLDELLARVGGQRLGIDLLARVAATLARNAVPAFESFWTTYGNFGAHQVVVSRAWPLVIAVVCLVALAGGLRGRRVGAMPPAPAAAWWAFGAATAFGLLMHPVRVVLLDGVDDLQGRWLFPLVVPVVVALAAGLRRALVTARASAAAGTLVATALGIVPLTLIIVPFFYASFPETYNAANLYLQGVYGRGADPQRAMDFVAPLSAFLLRARTVTFVATLAAAAAAIVIGARWPGASATGRADRDASRIPAA